MLDLILTIVVNLVAITALGVIIVACINIWILAFVWIVTTAIDLIESFRE